MPDWQAIWLGLTLQDHSQRSTLGSHLKTYVAQNLLSILSAKWPASLHFWMVQGRHEVDFVIEAKRSCMALEVKSAARWQEKDLAGLKAFLSATPHCKAGILCYNGEHAAPTGAKTLGFADQPRPFVMLKCYRFDLIIDHANGYVPDWFSAAPGLDGAEIVIKKRII